MNTGKYFLEYTAVRTSKYWTTVLYSYSQDQRRDAYTVILEVERSSAVLQ